VGKELFADFIHKYSFRSTRPLVKVNCAALPPDIMESELFGHEKGSFTGAVQSRLGRFELANQGTIFLDEIGELPFSLQSKLLRVLQNGEFERVGGQKTIKVNVRVIAATNRDLQNDTHSGKFREDLFYRLNVFPITIPPLRKRKEDIPLLAASFVKRLSEKHHKSFENLSKADLDRLNNYDWPGNIREMINLLERSIISSTGPTLKLDWLRTDAPAVEREALSSFQSIKDIDRSYIQKILLECNWKINGDDGAASRLGLHPNTLRSRLKKMNITRKGN
jgi:transcriptional regulator with GAF, ATPase, and Fis domain